jgi:hypothetical protein
MLNIFQISCNSSFIISFPGLDRMLPTEFFFPKSDVNRSELGIQ